MPSAVSRPSGVSQNTLAVSLLGSALFSFTLGHWILGGSVSVEINVTEKGTGASARAEHFLQSSFPAVRVTQEHLQLASSALDSSQPRHMETLLLTLSRAAMQDGTKSVYSITTC